MAATRFGHTLRFSQRGVGVDVSLGVMACARRGVSPSEGDFCDGDGAFSVIFDDARESAPPPSERALPRCGDRASRSPGGSRVGRQELDA